MSRKGALPTSTKRKIAERQQSKKRSNYPPSIAAHRGLGVVGGFNVGGASVGYDYDSLRLPPEIKDPRFQQDNYYIPQTDINMGEPNIVLNHWFDYYYRFHPLVGSLIDLHSLLPLSRFGLTGISDASILREYEEMADDCQMFERMVDCLRLYFLRGEAQPFLWWNDEVGRFTDITILDTNHIFVLGHYLLYSPEGDVTRRYQLRPDDYIRTLANSSNPIDQELITNFLDEKILAAVKQNMNVELDPFATEMIMRAANPWSIRGSSICEGILKDLIYEDTLRKAQNSIAQAHITPIKMWKIGDKDNPALPEDLAAFREVLFESNNDPQVNLITHHAVNLTIDGASGRILPLGPEFEHVENRILTRLFASKALTTGEGVQYANASVALRVLMSRYIPIRVTLENYFYRKCFLPVAITKGYYKITTAQLSHRVRAAEKDREPLYPVFDWRHKQSLIDDSNIKSLLIQLQQRSLMPMKVICDSLDLDYDYVKEYLKKEQGSVFDEPLLSARKAEIERVGADGKPTRFQVWFKSVFNWQRMLGGTAKEREALLKEKQPVEDTSQPDMPPGPGGEDAITPDNIGDIEDMDMSFEEGEGEGEGSLNKKPKTIMKDSSLNASIQRASDITRKWKPIVEKQLQPRKKDDETYKIASHAFSIIDKPQGVEWREKLTNSPHLEAMTKKSLSNLNIVLLGILAEQGKSLSEEGTTYYETSHKLPTSEFKGLLKTSIKNSLADTQKVLDSELTKITKNIISSFYDKRAVEIAELTPEARKSLKQTIDSYAGAVKQDWLSKLETLKDLSLPSVEEGDLSLTFVNDSVELSPDIVHKGIHKIWKQVSSSILDELRDSMYEIFTELTVKISNNLIKPSKG